MPALPVDFDPYNPIPNGPFYSIPSYYLQGPTGPLVIGSGLSVSLQGVISATGGGGAVAPLHLSLLALVWLVAPSLLQAPFPWPPLA